MACAKCGSRVEIEGLRVVDRGESNMPLDLRVGVDRKPGALLFKGTQYGGISARACGDCGYIELYAADPKGLLRASRSRKRS